MLLFRVTVQEGIMAYFYFVRMLHDVILCEMQLLCHFDSSVKDFILFV